MHAWSHVCTYLTNDAIKVIYIDPGNPQTFFSREGTTRYLNLIMLSPVTFTDPPVILFPFWKSSPFQMSRRLVPSAAWDPSPFICLSETPLHVTLPLGTFDSVGRPFWLSHTEPGPSQQFPAEYPTVHRTVPRSKETLQAVIPRAPWLRTPGSIPYSFHFYRKEVISVFVPS